MLVFLNIKLIISKVQCDASFSGYEELMVTTSTLLHVQQDYDEQEVSQVDSYAAQVEGSDWM